MRQGTSRSNNPATSGSEATSAPARADDNIEAQASAPVRADDNIETQASAPNLVLVSHTNKQGACTERDISAHGLEVIASHLSRHDFLSFRHVNRKTRKNLDPVWAKDTFYRLCQAALTDGDEGKGYQGGNKARVKRLLDLAAARKDKTLLHQLLTMQITHRTREIKEYGAHRPKGTLYGMLLKRGYVALNENDKGLAEIVTNYYAYFDDGEALRQAEHEKVFPKKDESDTRTLEERVKDTFTQQKPFDFMPIIKAINAASDAELEHQTANPRDTSTDLGKAIQAFRDAFDAVSRYEEIYNSKHYLQALIDADKHIKTWSLKDKVYSCQVVGYVQKNMPTNLLHAHAQSIHNICLEKKSPRDSPLFVRYGDGHIVFGRDTAGAGGLGDKFFAPPGITWKTLRLPYPAMEGAGMRRGENGWGPAGVAELFSNNTTRLIRLMQRSAQHPQQKQCVIM